MVRDRLCGGVPGGERFFTVLEDGGLEQATVHSSALAAWQKGMLHWLLLDL